MQTDVNALWDIARRNECTTKLSIANALGINRNTVGAIMEGEQQPTLLFMEKFVERFSVSGELAGKIFFG